MIQQVRYKVKSTINQLSLLFLLTIAGSWTIHGQDQAKHFVAVQNNQFIKNNEPYFFLGTNLWYGIYLGADENQGGKERLIRELDHLKKLGITNVRIMAGFEGPSNEKWRAQPAVQEAPKVFNEKLLRGLDYLLVEMGKRNMTAVVCLNNFFQWSGGMAQYVSWVEGTRIPYPHEEAHSWDDYQRYSATFFSNKKAQRFFKHFVKLLIKRKNSISGVRYQSDPVIMAWQLANEPRGYNNVDAYLEWVEKTAAFLQRKDKNHLVSLGGEGTTTAAFTGTAFEKVMQLEHLDYLTAHIWVENWSWYKPQEAKQTFDSAVVKAKKYIMDHLKMASTVNKPIVFEEFGISRDKREYAISGTTVYRDQYYQLFYEQLIEGLKQGLPMGGSNFWSWSGEGRPHKPGGHWKKGDDFIGDPPHENQGWYSIYDQDTSTLEIIQKYANYFNNLSKTKVSYRTKH